MIMSTSIDHHTQPKRRLNTKIPMNCHMSNTNHVHDIHQSICMCHKTSSNNHNHVHTFQNNYYHICCMDHLLHDLLDNIQDHSKSVIYGVEIIRFRQQSKQTTQSFFINNSGDVCVFFR